MNQRAQADDVAQGLVSIIIPAYNCAGYIGEAVASCLAQTYRPIEVIVVDDGSTDATRQTLQHYITGHAITYIHQENAGRSRARNRGIEAARGEFLQFLDGDDLLEPAKLERQVDFLLRHPDCLGVYCAATYFGELEYIFHRQFAWHTGVITRQIIKGNFIPINTMLTRRCDVRFDERMHTLEDWDYWFRLSLNGRRFGFIDQRLCRVRRHGKNTSADRMAMLRGELAALQKMESQGEYLGDIKYYMFERLYVLGIREAWRMLLDSLALDRRKLATSIVFILKIWIKRAFIGSVNSFA